MPERLRARLGLQNLVLCLDGLAALARPELQVVAILSKREFNDLLGSDAELMEYFTRIEIEEPHGDALVRIVHAIAAQLEQEFQLTIPEATVQRTLTLCSGYILNEHFPAKAARLLRRVCEDLDFDRTQQQIAVTEASPETLVQIVATTTGIPRTTLLGDAGETTGTLHFC